MTAIIFHQYLPLLVLFCPDPALRKSFSFFLIFRQKKEKRKKKSGSTFQSRFRAPERHMFFFLTAKYHQNKLTDRELVEAEHVVHADLRQDHAKEVGTLVGTSSDQEAAVAAPLRDELPRGGPLLLDEELGARLEVVKDVLLVADGPGVAPRGSVLTAAAEVGDGNDTAVAEGEDGSGDGEGGLKGDVEACACCG